MMGATVDEFEGTLVLEKLTEAGTLDDFYAAVDADDFKQAKRLMKRAGLDAETIQTVMNQMAEGAS